MKTELPSGVWIVPSFATRVNVRVDPARLLGAQTMPVFGVPGGRLLDAPDASSAPHATARTAGGRMRRALDIGLAHHRLRRQRGLVDPQLRHQPAGPGGALVRESAPVTVLE